MFFDDGDLRKYLGSNRVHPADLLGISFTEFPKTLHHKHNWIVCFSDFVVIVFANFVISTIIVFCPRCSYVGLIKTGTPPSQR